MAMTTARLRSTIATTASALALALLPMAAAHGALASSRLDDSPYFASLYSFKGGSDGGTPFSNLVEARDGNLYGTTAYGGSSGQGNVFRVTLAGVETVLHTFNGNDGANPFGGLIVGRGGVFYGTTFDGGPDSAGTVFRMTITGTVTTLHVFSGGSDGRSPHDLARGRDGNLYGTTSAAGANNNGVMYRITPRGKFTIVHTFSGGNDGGSPQSGLLLARDGNLYGTASQGGPSGPGVNGYGAVFRISPTGAFSTTYGFTGGSDGGQPLAGLAQGSDGNLYGTTSNNFGTVFKLTTAGVLTTLHSFAFSDGTLTQGAATLRQAHNGAFYSTAYGGGTNNGYGTIYKITMAGAFSVLHTFASSDGANPSAGLIQASNSLLYGATSYGGASGMGTIFRLPPS